MKINRTALVVALAATALAPACSRNSAKVGTIPTAPVTRRDVIIDAQANGVVEPINIVEVKSKAGGTITKMPAETGTLLKPGDLIVQIDARDVQNQYDQAQADLVAAQAKLDVSQVQKKRSDDMFAQKVITAQEHETAALDLANSNAAVIRQKAALDLAKQRLEDATVEAPVIGTVIEKDVSLGTVITSATGSVGGGTTIIKMADLTKVRMRAQFNETDIGQIKANQPAVVVVDAYPDRKFTGVVEKIEPQAVVQQGVTLFPVLVSLTNMDGALRPGMNGEVQVQIEMRPNVLAIPNDAIKNTRDAVATAPLLGLNPDSVQAQLRSQGRGGMGGGNFQRGNNGQRGNGQRNGGNAKTSGGEVDLAPDQGRQGGGGFQQVEVSDKECADIKTAMDKKPADMKKLDALREQMRSPDADRNALREEQNKLYTSMGVDSRKAGACRMKEMRASGGGFGGGNRGQNQTGGTSAPGGTGNQAGAAAPQLQLGNTERGASGQRVRQGLVFVSKGKTFEPRVVMLGSGNFDYTEVVSGLEEGEQVALLSALALQAQRQAQNDRMKAGMGGVPGMSSSPAPGGRGPGGGRGGR
ncbi:MAG TPA: efflux RND transporter periplasmic adaptor subunit [Burkholderiales bacterium]